MSEHDIMTVAEVAAYLGMSEDFVRDHASTNSNATEPIIPAFRMGRYVRFSRSAVRRFLEERMNQGVSA